MPPKRKAAAKPAAKRGRGKKAAADDDEVKASPNTAPATPASDPVAPVDGEMVKAVAAEDTVTATASSPPAAAAAAAKKSASPSRAAATLTALAFVSPKIDKQSVTSEVVLAPLARLREGFDSTAARTLANTIATTSWPSECAVAICHTMLDVYGSNDGARAAQAWVLGFLASQAASLVPHIALEDVEMLVAFATMIGDSPAVPAHLPVVIDLMGALYSAAIARCAAVVQDSDEYAEVPSVFASLETLRQQLKSFATPASAPPSAGPATHAANALLEVVLTLSQPSVLAVKNAAGTEEPAVTRVAPCAITETSHPALHDARRTLDETCATLLTPLMSPHNSMRPCLAFVNAVEQVLRQRSTLAAKIVPDLMRLAQPIGRKAPGSVAPGCLTPAFAEAFGAVCSTIGRAPSLSAYHRMAQTAASAVGGGLVMPPTYAPAAGPALTSAFVKAVAHDAGANEDDDQAAQARAEQAATVDTTLGNLPLTSVIDALVSSIRRLDSHQIADLAELHLDGLGVTQRKAAVKAQQAEYDKLRRNLARGVDAVPVGNLLAHLAHREETAMAKATNTLQDNRLRGAYARAAFHSSFDTFELLVANPSGAANVGRIVRAQAIVSRALALVPEECADECIDRLCEAFEQAKQADSKSTTARQITELAVQTLFTYALELTPTSTSVAFVSDTAMQSLFGTADSSVSAAVNKIDLEAPASWLLEGSGAGGANSGKRTRDGGMAGNESDGDDDDDAFELQDDASDSPSLAYSHLLCRLVHICLDLGDIAGALDLLISCPVITLPVWAVVNRALCQSNTTPRIDGGMALLAELIEARPPLAQRCLSLLLHYCMSSKKATRLYACKRVIQLAEKSPEVHGPIIQEFAKVAIAKVASVVTPKNVPAKPGQSSREVVQERVDRAVERYTRLFAFLCGVEPNLLSHLFAAVGNCNDAYVKERLAASDSIGKLFQTLADGKNSQGLPKWISCLNTVRNHPPGAQALAISALHVFGERLMRLTRDEASTEDEKRTYAKFARILVKQCTTLHQSHANDVRYMFPAFPFTPRSDLKEVYVRALLNIYDAADQSDRATNDIDSGMYSMFRNSGLGAEYGISPTDLFVLLHELADSGVVTTRSASAAIDGLLTRLTKRVDGEDLPLMSLQETTVGLHALVQKSPVPSLLMRSALVASATEPHAQRMQGVVLQGVVKELIRRTIWRQHPDIWRGVVLFIDKYWPATMNTLLTLPDKTLEETLRDNQRLRERVVGSLDMLPPLTQRLVREVHRASMKPTGPGLR